MTAPRYCILSLFCLMLLLCGCHSDMSEALLPYIEINSPIAYDQLIKQDEPCSIKISDSTTEITDSEAFIRLRGNSTAEFPKRPFQISLSHKKPVLGMAPAKKWVLLANYFDKTMLRNALAFRMAEDSRLGWTPHYCFVDLFYNGAYKGTYQLCEKVEVNTNRVNVPEDGWLIEIDARANENDNYFRTLHMENPFRIDWPHKTLTQYQKEQIQASLTQAETTLFGDNFTHPVDGWRKYLDEDTWVDWFLINEIAKNGDGNFYSSCYMHQDTCGKIAMGPLWDYDTCFGNNIFDAPRNPEGFYVRDAQWFARLMEDSAFAEKVRNRFSFFYAQQAIYYDFIRKTAADIRPRVDMNNSVWHTIGAQISPFLTPNATYDEDVEELVLWLQKRFEWLKNNL